MNKYFVFNKTVQGHLHIMKNRPCEDSSVSYVAKDNQYFIAIVADGHGSNSCFRSQSGSTIATMVTLEALKKFADYHLMKDENGFYTETDEFVKILKSERSKKHLIKQLTDSIVSDWYQVITDDISNHPLTDDEINSAESDYADLYRRGLKLNHIYGTTLIAVLVMQNYVILLQQGDGRCDVFYSDSTVNQPIPWDERCFDVYTTSMCDDDVDTSMRSTIIDIREKPVVACYIGSDGVEDSFRTMDGTHNFYMQLSTKIIDDQEHFIEYLDSFLPKFSESGSGDDVSVAGVVNIEQVKELYSCYKNRVEAYQLSETKIQIKAKIDSMSRKHGILQSRLKKELEELTFKTEEWIIAIARFEELTKEVERLQKQVDEGIDIPLDDNQSKKESSDLIGVLTMIKNQFPAAFSIIANTFKKHHVGAIPSIVSVYERAKMALQSHKKQLNDLSIELQTASKSYNSLSAEFEEYDNKYVKLNEELTELDLKIEKLQAP